MNDFLFFRESEVFDNLVDLIQGFRFLPYFFDLLIYYVKFVFELLLAQFDCLYIDVGGLLGRLLFPWRTAVLLFHPLGNGQEVVSQGSDGGRNGHSIREYEVIVDQLDQSVPDQRLALDFFFHHEDDIFLAQSVLLELFVEYQHLLGQFASLNLQIRPIFLN